jgi:hypothetical protein
MFTGEQKRWETGKGLPAFLADESQNVTYLFNAGNNELAETGPVSIDSSTAVRTFR